MNASRPWLDQLAQATDYRQLEEVFSAMVADAHQPGGGEEDVAGAIDLAIRRLEEERARDATQLNDFQQQYDAFRDQQSGVVGWFKRHLPFTETRRQELSLRGQLSDQQAEILADRYDDYLFTPADGHGPYLPFRGS